MKLKKFGALMLSAMMLTGAFVGCGSTKEGGSGSDKQASAGETQDVTLKIWVPEEEVDITDAMVKKFDEIHDEFNITYEIAVVGIDEAPANLETDADTAADIFYTPSGGVADLANKGLLLPIVKDFELLRMSFQSQRLMQ